MVNLKTYKMKLKCNVCIESPIVTLPVPEEDKMIYCPECGKQMAIGCIDCNVIHKPYWSVIDNEHCEDFGGVPVEIVES